MKYLSLYVVVLIAFFFAGCADFLDTYPHDSMSPEVTWKTESDVENFVVGCYNGLWDGTSILYLDCGSDLAYNNFPWEGYRSWGDGSISSANPGASYYDFTTIQRCNIVLDNIDKVKFVTPGKKEDLIAEVKTMRAYKYFVMNWLYGGVPIVKPFKSAKEAQVPRNTEYEVRQYIAKDLDDALVGIYDKPVARGRIAKGTVLAIKMREALYYGEWQKAQDAAQAIIDLHQYSLDPDYANLFKLTGVNSKEIIVADQCVENTFGFTLIHQMYNNGDGGWSSLVPTQNLIDMYEMKDGLTKDESSLYDPTHPFANRDPRMAITILYPGRDWRGHILNTLDKKLPDGSTNMNYPTDSDNSSKTSLTWAKYTDPMDQYTDIWDTGTCVIVFRYAEVLLTYAEAANELNGPSLQIYDYIDAIRSRVHMPVVDRSKYATKDKLRELIHRERTIELAEEGFRRADLIRWKDSSGKMEAQILMNGALKRVQGTINYSENDPTKRAVISPNRVLIETRKFEPRNRYLPIPQSSMDKNPNLVQNPRY